MATKVSPGRIMRRGTDGLTPAQLKDLLDNAGKVEEILGAIGAKRDLFIEVEQKATKRLREVEKLEADLAEREAKLTDDYAALDDLNKKADLQHKSDMEALSRRTREVMDKERAAVERDTALYARANDIEAKGRDRENELQAREADIEVRENDLDEREQKLQADISAADATRNRLDTAAKMFKQAVATLG